MEKKRHASKTKGEKTELPWLMSASPPATKALSVPRKHCFTSGVVMLFFLGSFFYCFPVFFYFLFFSKLLAETGPKY